MDVTSHPHGKPSWTDLATADIDASRAFYGGLFGWDTETDPRLDNGYTFCSIRGRRVAALHPLGDAPVERARWSVYVTVQDAADAASRVAPAGGRLIAEPFEVLDAARVVVAEDPSGAPLGLWEPVNGIGSEVVDEPGCLAWVQLDDAHDTERTLSFYRSLFGWAPEGEGYVSFHLDGHPIAGMAEPNSTGPASWTVYFGTDDRDAAITAIEDLGGRVAVVSDGPRFVYAVDPTGVPFAVLELFA